MQKLENEIKQSFLQIPAFGKLTITFLA